MKKNAINQNFIISLIIQALFKNQNSVHYEWARKETTKNLWFTWRWNQTKVSLSTVYSAQKKNYRKRVFQEKGSGGLNKKLKVGFLTPLATAIKKDPTMSIRKHANELKVHKKTVRTAIKQDLSPDLNLFDYAIWSVLENKINEFSHANIGSLKTALEKESNKMSEEIFFWRHENRFEVVLKSKWWL